LHGPPGIEESGLRICKEDFSIRTQLNLASSPVENQRPFFVVALAVGLPALLLCVALCVRVVRDRAATSERRGELTRLRSDIAELRSQSADLERFFSDPGTRLLTQRAAFLNTIIDERSFPWTEFFLNLEHRLPGGVRILTLGASLSGDHLQVKMRVGALNDKSKLEFLKALEEAPEFSALELNSESRPSKAEDADTVQMDLMADYRAVPPSRKNPRTGGGQ
jgi:Tfp pilus assembly protein PilN